jgi:hypothetical protein
VYDLALAEVVKKRIIPTIRQLVDDKESAPLFQFPIHAPTSDCVNPLLLDFRDLPRMEEFGNGFQTKYAFPSLRII